MENPPTHDGVIDHLITLQSDPNPFRAAVKLLTGFTDDQLDDLGGFAGH